MSGFEELYHSTALGRRKGLSQAHGFGHEEGYNEARAELYQRVLEVIDDDALDVREWVVARIQKLRRLGRIPEGFDRELDL